MKGQTRVRVSVKEEIVTQLRLILRLPLQISYRTRNASFYDDELEQILTFLHNTWINEYESVNEKTQSSTKQPIIIKNPIIQDGLAFTRRDLQCTINIDGC